MTLFDLPRPDVVVEYCRYGGQYRQEFDWVFEALRWAARSEMDCQIHVTGLQCPFGYLDRAALEPWMDMFWYEASSTDIDVRWTYVHDSDGCHYGVPV